MYHITTKTYVKWNSQSLFLFFPIPPSKRETDLGTPIHQPTSQRAAESEVMSWVGWVGQGVGLHHWNMVIWLVVWLP